MSPGVCVPACFSVLTSDKPASAVLPSQYKSYLESSERHFASDVFILSLITSSLSLPHMPFIFLPACLSVPSLFLHVMSYFSLPALVTKWVIRKYCYLLTVNQNFSIRDFKLVRKYRGVTCLELVELVFIDHMKQCACAVVKKGKKQTSCFNSTTSCFRS